MFAHPSILHESKKLKEKSIKQKTHSSSSSFTLENAND
jgi:hypothetical protein